MNTEKINEVLLDLAIQHIDNVTPKKRYAEMTNIKFNEVASEIEFYKQDFREIMQLEG